jgi:hypothetical protein
MTKPFKLGFAFMPRKATEQEVDDYLKRMYETFPDCTIMLSALHLNDVSFDINKPFLHFVTACRHRHDLVARYYALIAQARVEGLDYLVFNLGLKRYPADVFAAFAREAQTAYPAADLVIGEPHIDDTGPASDFAQAIGQEKVRQRLLVDSFINFALARALDRDYANFNAGVFAIRTKKDVVKTLLSVEHYEDSTLVCPQIVWHLDRAGFLVRKLTVRSISLHHLGFNLQKAIREINYILKLMAASGRQMLLAEAVDSFFATCEFVRQWVAPKDIEWFWSVVVEGLRKSN